MAKKSSHFFSKFDQSIIRLYLAFIWRFLAWTISLNFIFFIFFEGFLLFIMNVSSLAHYIFVLEIIRIIMRYVFHLLSCYLALESLMKYGYKSGRYRLVVEYTNGKKKLRV